MILTQYYLGCLAHASYLVADEESEIAAIVDPQRDVDQYIADTEAQGPLDPLRDPHPFPRRLRGRASRAARPCAAPRSSWGRRRRRSSTAGRSPPATRSTSAPRSASRCSRRRATRPESITIVVYDAERGERALRRAHGRHAVHRRRRPARPAGRARLDRRGPRQRCSTSRSRRRILPLPDETLVYPAHGAGSLCGKNLSTDTVSTIGVQRQYNYALQPMTKDEFVRIVTTDQPDSPAYFTYDAVLNTKERPTLDEALERELKPLGSGRGDRAPQSRRPGARHARPDRVRGRAPPRLAQRRARRELRDLVRHPARSRSADRDRRRPGS